MAHTDDDDNTEDRCEDDNVKATDERARAPESNSETAATTTTTTSKRKRKRKRKQGSSSSNKDEDDDIAKQQQVVTPDDSLLRTVYVEGIPFDCTVEDVRDFFVSTLQITNVIELRLPTWQDSGRLRGFGHVVFETTTSRDEAIRQSDQHYLKNRYVTIQEAKPSASSIFYYSMDSDQPGSEQPSLQQLLPPPRPQPPGCRTIFCRNLPFEATEQDVEDVFRSCGKIVEGGVRIARNYKTKQSKGFGYIEFKHPEGALAAVTRPHEHKNQQQPWIVQGRLCTVDYDEGTVKGSYKTESGRLWSKEYHRSPHEVAQRKHGTATEPVPTKRTKKSKLSE